MLWSLLKILVFVALIGALAFGAEILISSSDYIQIVLFGTEYTLPPLYAVIALAVMLLGMWFLLKLAGFLVALLRFINGDETAMSRFWDRRCERRGYEALSDGMIALASGDHRTAIAKAQRAEKFLRRPELTTLLTAQAASAAGDAARAGEAYKKLLQNDKTRFVGVSGLLAQKLEEGDSDKAIQLAEKAFALRPRHGATQDVLLKLQAQDENWAGARQTLTAKLKSGTLPKDVHKRRSAVLALASARDDLAEGKTEPARAEALEANRLSPDLVPAAVLAARMQIEAGGGRAASKVLKTAWKTQPHPDLAAAYADIAPDETPVERLKRFTQLIRMNPEHPESKMLDAELHLTTEDYPGARKALGDLVERQPTTRALSLMAAIERGEGADDNVVRGWLTRALSVSRGPQWVCESCGTVHGAWAPVCENCSGFDTLSWTEPKQSAEAPAARTEMLPLVMGALEPEPAKEVAAPEGDVVEAETSAPAQKEATAK